MIIIRSVIKRASACMQNIALSCIKFLANYSMMMRSFPCLITLDAPFIFSSNYFLFPKEKKQVMIYIILMQLVKCWNNMRKEKENKSKERGLLLFQAKSTSTVVK